MWNNMKEKSEVTEPFAHLIGKQPSCFQEEHEKVDSFSTADDRVKRVCNKKSYLSIPGEKPLLGITIGDLVDEAAEKYGEAEAVYFANSGSRRTFTQLKKEVDELAAGFLSLGFRKGDRIGIWGPNSLPWYLVLMASVKAGLILVTINPAYQAVELLYCLKKVGIKCLLISEPFKTQDYYEILTNVVPEVSASEPGKILSAQVPMLTHVISLFETPLSGVFTFNELFKAGRTPEAKEILEKVIAQVQFDDVCNIQFTSGTTGNAKGVMLSHHNVVNNSFYIGKRFLYSQKDKICVTVPLFHCYGCVIGALAGLHCGATVVFPGPGFNPKLCVETASKEKCTVIYGTPTMHIDMMNIPNFEEYDMTSLRLACTAGAVCPEKLIKEMKSKYTVDAVGSLYGMTETSPVFIQSLTDDTDVQRSQTVGYPHEHVEVKLVDSDGRIVPTGTAGEMCVRGYVTMQGYWDDPEHTAEVIKSSKWLHTGDLAIMTETGHARIVGRLKDMIIRGGENIYPREIEDFLHTNPKIQEAQVFGVPDPRLGEVVAAWIYVKEGESLSEENIREFCKGQISHYKIPKYITFTKEFPKTTSGKVQKFKMRDECAKQFGLI